LRKRVALTVTSACQKVSSSWWGPTCHACTWWNHFSLILAVCKTSELVWCLPFYIHDPWKEIQLCLSSVSDLLWIWLNNFSS
jgi:hypothetical protein